MLSEEKNVARKKRRKIPGYLIYEMMDGNPIYYKGFKSVLNKTKTIDDIIGSSVMQSYILMYLQMILFKKSDMEKFIILSNELGLHLGTGNNLAGDLLIYDKQKLTADKIKKVIWIFTYSQQINIAEQSKDWIVSTWNKDIEIIEGITFNIGNYLEENGIAAE